MQTALQNLKELLGHNLLLLCLLLREYENELQLEMEHLEDLRARSGRTREDEERRTLQQTVMLRKQLDTTHEMREKLRDSVSQWRMKVKARRGSRGGKGKESNTPSLLPSSEQGAVLQVGEVGAESGKQKQGNQRQQQRQNEVELQRINRDILNISNKLSALRQERDELETLKAWWRAKLEGTMEEEESLNQNTNFKWEETDKWRDMLQNALEEEEHIARQSLYAMELAARGDKYELEWCVQSRHKSCGCTVRYEMHEVRLQSVTRENNLRQQLEKLRIESVRLEQQRNTYSALDECGETALEKEELVLWRTSQLLEACLRVDTPFIRAKNIIPSVNLTDWRSGAQKLMLQLQRVKREILVVKNELETLRLKCSALEKQTAAEEDSLEAIMLEKKALKWYVRAYEQDA
ncbi:hypothetical protein LSM04_002567 [Trypanosoma melophagium]|uniref:uncharacterized protein n=1 Tax=Trypanosoma melophagium TaxID=715481 RepID=UPI00351A6FB1|nr:hypothetical protein LSM04_002567 [Trypanosoma melophagium]